MVHPSLPFPLDCILWIPIKLSFLLVFVLDYWQTHVMLDWDLIEQLLQLWQTPMLAGPDFCLWLLHHHHEVVLLREFWDFTWSGKMTNFVVADLLAEDNSRDKAHYNSSKDRDVKRACIHTFFTLTKTLQMWILAKMFK